MIIVFDTNAKMFLADHSTLTPFTSRAYDANFFTLDEAKILIKQQSANSPTYGRYKFYEANILLSRLLTNEALDFDDILHEIDIV